MVERTIFWFLLALTCSAVTAFEPDWVVPNTTTATTTTATTTTSTTTTSTTTTAPPTTAPPTTTTTATLVDLLVNCDNCRWVNGAGYKPYPGDCTRYIQCGTDLVLHVKQCPAGLFWDKISLVCNWPSLVPCVQTTQSTSRPTPTTSTAAPAPSCDGSTRAVAGNSAAYQENVPGLGWIDRACAPGTVFVESICICDHGSDIVVPECKAELYLPFRSDLLDHSGNQYAIENPDEQVRLRFGKALFNGYEGLRVLRFTNMDFQNTLHISLIFAEASSKRFPQALVSNSDCDKVGTISIIKWEDSVRFTVVNNQGRPHVLVVPARGIHDYVSLSVAGGTMTAQVGKIFTSTSFAGTIGISQCALQIGRGFDCVNFIGYMKQLKVYTCIPEPLTSGT